MALIKEGRPAAVSEKTLGFIKALTDAGFGNDKGTQGMIFELLMNEFQPKEDPDAAYKEAIVGRMLGEDVPDYGAIREIMNPGSDLDSILGSLGGGGGRAGGAVEQGIGSRQQAAYEQLVGGGDDMMAEAIRRLSPEAYKKYEGYDSKYSGLGGLVKSAGRGAKDDPAKSFAATGASFGMNPFAGVGSLLSDKSKYQALDKKRYLRSLLESEGQL